MAENKKSLLAPVYKWLDEFMEYIYLALSRKIKKSWPTFGKPGAPREAGAPKIREPGPHSETGPLFRRLTDDYFWRLEVENENSPDMLSLIIYLGVTSRRY